MPFDCLTYIVSLYGSIEKLNSDALNSYYSTSDEIYGSGFCGDLEKVEPSTWFLKSLSPPSCCLESILGWGHLSLSPCLFLGSISPSPNYPHP